MTENHWKKPKDIEGELMWKNGFSWRDVFFQVSSSTIYLYSNSRKDSNQVLRSISFTQVEEIMETRKKLSKSSFQIVLKTGMIEQFRCSDMDSIKVQQLIENLRHAMQFWMDKENLQQKRACQRRVTLEEEDEASKSLNVEKHRIFFTLWNGELVGLLVNVTSTFTEIFPRLFSCQAGSCRVCKIRRHSSDLWAVNTSGIARQVAKNEILVDLDKAGNCLFVMEHRQKLFVVHFSDYSYEVIHAPASITAKEILKHDQIALKLNKLSCFDPGLFLREETGNELQFCMNDIPFKYRENGMIVARSKRIRINSLKKSNYEKIAELRWKQYLGFLQNRKASNALSNSIADQIQNSCNLDEELCFFWDHFALDDTGMGHTAAGMQACHHTGKIEKVEEDFYHVSPEPANDIQCQSTLGSSWGSAPHDNVIHYDNWSANNCNDDMKTIVGADDIKHVPDRNCSENICGVMKKDSVDFNFNKNDNETRFIDHRKDRANAKTDPQDSKHAENSNDTQILVENMIDNASNCSSNGHSGAKNIDSMDTSSYNGHDVVAERPLQKHVYDTPSTPDYVGNEVMSDCDGNTDDVKNISDGMRAKKGVRKLSDKDDVRNSSDQDSSPSTYQEESDHTSLDQVNTGLTEPNMTDIKSITQEQANLGAACISPSQGLSILQSSLEDIIFDPTKSFSPNDNSVIRCYSDSRAFYFNHLSEDRVGIRRSLSDLNVRYSFTSSFSCDTPTHNSRAMSEPDLVDKDDNLQVSAVFIPQESLEANATFSESSPKGSSAVVVRQNRVSSLDGPTWSFAKKVEDIVQKVLDARDNTLEVERIISEELCDVLFRLLEHGMKRNRLGISLFSATNVWEICRIVCKITNIGITLIDRIKEGNIREKFHIFIHESIRREMLSQWFEMLSSEEVQKRMSTFYEPNAAVLEPEHSEAMEHLKLFLDRLSVLKLKKLKARQIVQNTASTVIILE